MTSTEHDTYGCSVANVRGTAQCEMQGRGKGEDREEKDRMLRQQKTRRQRETALLRKTRISIDFLSFFKCAAHA